MSERECLQCGQTPAEVKRNQTYCDTLTSGEYVEVDAEWERHRWADWNDADLARSGVRPEAYDRHRRTLALYLQWIACEDTTRGHIPAKTDDVPDFASHVGQCICCGRPSTDREIRAREEQS